MAEATATPSAGIALGFALNEGRSIPAGSQPLPLRDDGRPPVYPTRGNDQTDEPLDALAMLVQQHCSDHNAEVDFNPNARVLIQNSVLTVQHDDDVSAMTPLTAWDGMSVVTRPDRQQPRGSNAPRPSSSSGGRSIASHEINEPRLPEQSEDPVPMNSPDISVLRELVGDLLLAGNVELAIDCLTNSIKDNAHSKDFNLNLACFCLTKLWDLARESDANKRAIISGQYTDVIIETMKLFNELSCEIERIGCSLLWSLGMMVENRPLIAEKGGVEAILNAQLRYKNDLQLQIMAMGALKVLSFDPRAKGVMRRKFGTDVVASIMNEHTFDATIQSDGCVIIGNCAVDEAGNFAETRVYEREIEAVLASMTAHEGSLVVVEAALFTLMSLACRTATSFASNGCSNSNATVIRKNNLINIALEKDVIQLTLNLLGKGSSGFMSSKQQQKEEEQGLVSCLICNVDGERV
ncbi:hypothetical protein THAOC_11256 [Thalassiosira oceanica]|uniref:Ataxin-10 domain-containing protein n=1 Tax=Thalassiosira oceanica TaxID=159749 RepID=K0SQR5_THAOC|nr:hypothetical protein THAOC_11256 [Thalassiosira oceanica]|eukprot:EJK67680.1 hypothetical protein THAOC_11256 [Thalassiosira oceanica]